MEEKGKGVDEKLLVNRGNVAGLPVLGNGVNTASQKVEIFV